MGDRCDGNGWESCACVHGGAAAVFTGRGGDGDKEFDGERDIWAVSAGEAGAMGGEFWGDGYYVRTVGSEVTAAVIREYIKKQGQETRHKGYEQLKLF